MAINLFVGGLPYETTQEEVEKLFAACGKVTSVKLIMDRETSRSKGFGFVEMSTEEEARTAIRKLNCSTLGQRQIFVSEARPQEQRPAAGFTDKPRFVERRSGVKDRRRQPGGFGGAKKWGDKPAGSGVRRESFGGARKWGSKPGGFGGGKKWGDKPPAGGKRREGFGGEKKWGSKPDGFGGKKWGAKPGGFGGAHKPGGFGRARKPGGFGGGGKRGAGGKRG